MTETTGDLHQDPTTAPYWEAAREHRLVLQRCADCRVFQFYPRPFCLTCQSDAVGWVTASGLGVVHSRTTTHIAVTPGLTPPYAVAVVELDEGPWLVTNLVGGPARIGDRVEVTWRERPDGPPLPVFRPLPPGGAPASEGT
ncbi:Zn-ribbon domain-containing OB-fold protein [Streptomyces sp. NPDC051018]|uniref:Zn-ribbon domain-containing OB-fold protein n=1 Tax=Streptomyces sp. NPDC051018 TaxID=3365639 RepID=UPI00379A3010